MIHHEFCRLSSVIMFPQDLVSLKIVQECHKNPTPTVQPGRKSQSVNILT